MISFKKHDIRSREYTILLREEVRTSDDKFDPNYTKYELVWIRIENISRIDCLSSTQRLVRLLRIEPGGRF
jgi:hypothetical protein